MIINIAGGNGIMGKVHAPIFEEEGHKVIISGRKTKPNLEDAAKIADLTIISVPIPVTEEVIKKVAPYSKALMDFTSVKTFPIEWMLKYSNKNCEVAGLHPLYREPQGVFLHGHTIVYSPTARTGKKCKEIIRSLKSDGAKIKKMNAEQHDKYVLSLTQNSRHDLFTCFALLMMEQSKKYKRDFKELYKLSPPPTKNLIDLISRQFDPENDEMYIAMKKYNPYYQEAKENLLNGLLKAMRGNYDPKKIREFYGKDLKSCQERAQRHLKIYDF